MTQGFRIGFDREGVTLESAKHNMHSAAEEPDVVRSYLQAEKDAGRVLGPVPGELGCRVVHVSRFGVIAPAREVEADCGLVAPSTAQCE